MNRVDDLMTINSGEGPEKSLAEAKELSALAIQAEKYEKHTFRLGN